MTRVQLKVGHLRQVVPSALSFSFELVAQGTSVEGATLDIEAVPAIGECRQCGARTRLENFPLQCGACGAFNPLVVAGEELIVETLDLEEANVGTPCG